MGGTAPANQPRLSFTGSEDGEAENGSLQNGEALVANDDSTLRPARAQLAEPPYADSPVRWCGRGEQVPAPPIPIGAFLSPIFRNLISPYFILSACLPSRLPA